MARQARNTVAQQTAVDTNARKAEFAGTLAKFNPALVPAAPALALAYDNTQAMLTALQDAEAVSRAATLATAIQVAESNAIVKGIVANIEKEFGDFEYVDRMLTSVRSDFLKTLAHEINSYAQALRIGVLQREPWFAMRANKLPEQIAKWRERLIKGQKESGHSNPDESWKKIREHAEAEAMLKSWWGLSPDVQKARQALAEAEAEARKNGETEGETEGGKSAKTPHQKAVAQIKSLVKGVKKDGSGLDTPDIRAALEQVCKAFSLDYGTI